jgi:oligopeptide transport system substrate-binding protein
MRFWGLLLILLVAAAPAACRPKEDTSGNSEQGRQLHVAMREVASLDPAFLNSSDDHQVAANVHAALFTWDPIARTARPDLVRSFEVDDAHLVWRFTIKDGARFSDGTPITAKDFEFAWRRILNPATASPGADALYFIKGARACTAGGGEAPAIQAIDKHTLRIELESPQPFLPALLASPRFAPVPASLDEPTKDIYRGGKLICSGAYVLESWTSRQGMVLRANPYYRSKSPRLSTVQLHFTESEETALKWWDTGTVDLVSGLVPFARIRFLKEQYGAQLVSQPMRSVFYYMANVRNSPTNSVELRRALFEGLDREGLVLEVLGAGQEAAYSFVPHRYGSAIGFTPRSCPRTDPQRAALNVPGEIAAAAAGSELLSNRSQTLKHVLEYTQQSVKQLIGIHFAIRLLEWKSYLAMLKKGDFTLARMSLTGGVDPVDFLDNFTSESSNNFSRFDNPEYNALVKRVHETGESAARFELMHQAHAILCRELPAIPVYFSTQVYLVRKHLIASFAPDDEGTVLWHQLGEVLF